MLRIIKIFILCLAMLSGIKSYAQNPVYDHWYDMGISYPLPWFSFKATDYRQLWAEHPSPKFNCYVNIGSMFAGNGGFGGSRRIAGPDFNVSAGVRFNPYLYAGLESGYHSVSGIEFIEDGDCLAGMKWTLGYVPVDLNVRGILPLGKIFCPFTEISAGAFFGSSGLKGTDGFHFRAGVGVEITRFVISAGYNGLVTHGDILNMGYVTVGIRFGR
ncbi:MAG: hypothetical protein NC080_04795 [Paraprevotella sp.]|nr:hypothetical protein [Paraprevotella sp.]